MIDLIARKRYFESRKNKEIHSKLENINNSIKEKPEPNHEAIIDPINKVGKTSDTHMKLTLFLLASLKDIRKELAKLNSSDELSKIKESIDGWEIPQFPEEIRLNEEQNSQLLNSINSIKIPEPLDRISVNEIDTLINEFKDLKKILSQPKPEAPKIAKIEGKVEVVNLPKIKEGEKLDISPIVKSLEELKVLLSVPVQKEAPVDFTPMLSLLENINDGITQLTNVDEDLRSKKVEVTNFPMQLTPQPVTNININPLQGFTKTTSNTVGVAAVLLPNYGQLFNRRSMIIYNNSSNMIYIGGSDVTTGNGFPIPANSYSPAIDAGYNLKVYGIAEQAGNNVRVIEISKDQTENTQQ
ncbi:hypothetical protein M1437_03250 [Patescibacteria group bacterium]|nr:hypothetical protein [Patescibacteria group bacterium]